MVRGRRGFTLVEMMMAVGIIGLAAALLPYAVVNASRFVRMSMTQMELQREARTLIDIMNRRLRNAQAATITIDRLDANQPPYSQIQFIPQGGTAIITFQQNGSQFEVVEPGGAGNVVRVFSRNISQLMVVYPDVHTPGVISVYVIMEKGTGTRERQHFSMSSENIRIMN